MYAEGHIHVKLNCMLRITYVIYLHVEREVGKIGNFTKKLLRVSLQELRQ